MPTRPARRATANPAAHMTLRAHLVEARRRLVLAAAGIAVGAVLGWFLYVPLLSVLQAPLRLAAAEHDTAVALNFTGLASALDMRIKAAGFVGLLVSCPWWLYQLWAFVTPGLTRHERRYAAAFLGAAVPLFLGGSALAWWVLPHAVDLLAGFVPDGATNYTDAQGYLSFVMRLVVAFGVAFLSPVVVVALNLAGVVRHEALRTTWRWAVLGAFAFAAVMTPTPDALTMVVVALPICALYFGALGLTVLHDRRVDAARSRALNPQA